MVLFNIIIIIIIAVRWEQVTCRTFPLQTYEKYRNVPLHKIYMVTNFDSRTEHRFRCTSLKASFLYK